VLSTQLAEVASERDDWQRESRSGRQRLAVMETAARGKELELQEVRRAYEVGHVAEFSVGTVYRF
jgi:hypothetical protein